MNHLEIIRRFVVECERTKFAYDLFHALFNRGDWQRQLFYSTAPKTFGDLNEILIEHFYLQVSKLTDPARSQRKYDDLTTNYIVECIPWPDQVKNRLIGVNRRLMAFSAHFTEYRNKRGAHLDLLANTDQQRTLGSFPEGQDTTFFNHLEEFLQIAIGHFSPDEQISLDIAMSDDVDGLVKAIERSVAFTQCT
nr:hypothetical protein [uncultured Rhodopila sp.]